MPQPTATRPEGPAVERDLPPEPDEVAQLDLIQSRWPAVLELVRADNVKAEAMLKEARPTRLRRRVLRLSYPASRGFHARAVASQEFDAVVIPAIERTCDVTVRLEVDVDGESAGGGGPKHREPATTTSPADLAAARAAASSSGSSATGDDPTADAPNADGQSSSSTAAEGRGDGAGSLEANPMADLDPAAAMDRAAASLVDQLGATEVDVETP